MHFHVVEKPHASGPRLLSGPQASTYPTIRPTFLAESGAARAVLQAARRRWGPAVGAILSTELTAECAREPAADQERAAMWRNPEDMLDGALWSIRPCGCLDGSLAELLAGPEDAFPTAPTE